MDGIVAAVLSLFFVVGIAVGIITVMALSARRVPRRPGQGGFSGENPYGPGPQSPDPGPYRLPEDRRRWS